MDRLKLFFRELFYPGNLLIILYLILLLVVWGYFNWRESVPGSASWWFDLLGHVQFGFVCFFVGLYLLRRFRPDIYKISPELFLAVFGILFAVFMQVLIWEGWERFIWDGLLQPYIFPWLAWAQKGDLDTTSDNWVTAIGSVVAMISRRAIIRRWEKKHPNEALKAYQKLLTDKARQLGEEAQKSDRQHKKEVRREFLQAFLGQRLHKTKLR
ncbi:hypothetical protein HYT01_03645 [Candidatus Giovannonibacteria bacterium]|nr:hypothetical protein [Candidatus Giovannonibacteria bacterium]